MGDGTRPRHGPPRRRNDTRKLQIRRGHRERQVKLDGAPSRMSNGEKEMDGASDTVGETVSLTDPISGGREYRRKEGEYEVLRPRRREVRSGVGWVRKRPAH